MPIAIVDLGSIVRNPGKYAVAFVNAFLKQIEDAGLWTRLWQISLGDRTGGTEIAPEPPVIGE